MSPARQCTRATCAKPAAATLTYVYADSTAVLGPLATHAEPHSYDLCGSHAERLTVPRGWEVVRLDVDLTAAAPTTDDLAALADAVREASRSVPRRATPPSQGRHAVAAPQEPPLSAGARRRGHLRVLDGGE
ncbi:DUF3499 domain-containing protein [Litorihabitans aurantiacus]|uniref:DUF3499 domain-containing protein n=1 Tax=Litorihabitans aurantiacus TaxID=1930061 RepID=A0AA37USM1_9MICO|nr:DUF3499 domain-containing protein [Litorihabitans aurantiacus]GMA30635.1 hypothetical protein GCM10025875_06270 [Litorihabitans aurantiacus]